MFSRPLEEWMQLAISMDVDSHEKSVLQEENAYFDAMHTRIHGFKQSGSMDVPSSNEKNFEVGQHGYSQ